MPRHIAGLFVAFAMTLLAGAAFAYPAYVTNDLNLRSGPSTGYRVIAVMPRGSTVDVLGCSGRWCEVEWRGRIGFASGSYLAEQVAERRPVAPPSITIPLPGFGIDIRPVPVRPDRPQRAVCDERRALWAIGEFARRSTIQAAAEAARARTVRVVGPGEAVTFDYRPDRLTIDVDRRDRIVDLSCG